MASSLLVKRIFFESHISLPGTRRAIGAERQPLDVLRWRRQNSRDARRAALAGADPVLLVIDRRAAATAAAACTRPIGKRAAATRLRRATWWPCSPWSRRRPPVARSAQRGIRLPPPVHPARRQNRRAQRRAGGSAGPGVAPTASRLRHRLAVDGQLVADQHHAVAALRRRAGPSRPDCSWPGRGVRSPSIPEDSGNRRACSGTRGWSRGACCRGPGTRRPMCARSGHSHWFLPSTMTHSTLMGEALSSCSARCAGPRLWTSQSPSDPPVEKSMEGAPLVRHQRIERPRLAAGPSQRSQSSVAGTGCASGPVAGRLGWPP